MSTPTEVQDACLEALRAHGTNASGFLALNSGNSYFTEPGIDGVLPYRATRRAWVQFGGPVAAPADRGELLAAFIDRARQERVRILGVQLLPEDAELQQQQGFHVNQFGTSFSISLPEFTLRGQTFVKTRNMISRARREGADVVELDTDPAAPATGMQQQLDQIDASWLRDKGWYTRELKFFVGERSGVHNHLRRIFVVRHQDRVAAYVTYSPVYGAQPGWLYDLTRRRPDAPKGAIELAFAAAAEQMRDHGDSWLHLGLTPFVGLGPEHELDGCHRSAARSIRLLADHGNHLYPAASQLSFKHKWRPQQSTPEYLTFEGRLSLRDVWQLMKVANLI